VFGWKKPGFGYRVRKRVVRALLPRVAPSLRLQRLCPGPSTCVPVVLWQRSHLLPGWMALVGMRQMVSWQVASPLATTGAHALRMAL
jgi:hypothetical protein